MNKEQRKIIKTNKKPLNFVDENTYVMQQKITTTKKTHTQIKRYTKRNQTKTETQQRNHSKKKKNKQKSK